MVSLPNETHSDEGDYELISDTDGESGDGNLTESIASADGFPRAEDVASLADTEKSGEYSDEDEDAENRTMEASLDVFANTLTIGHSIADYQRILNPPIEFQEPASLGAENVSVKHTIADFSEDRTAEIVESVGLCGRPKRLVATIHQTMTKQGLSMEDPLRILYVGSHAAKQDIIHKVASSVTASVDNKFRIQSARNASQLYNVVPVSDFGSERTPEIELMQSSGYQINVEDCVSAINMKFENQPGKPDVIKLTLDGGFSYHSVPEGSDFIVEPTWDLPDVAIIYCSATDDLDARKTRTLAKRFMSRHGIPSMVISHKQVFDKSLGCMLLDQHALHMCLESRDPNGARNIVHQRLPIDLASFLNVDARQMNRNLAYLTGRYEIQQPTSLLAAKPDTTVIESTPSYLKGVVPDAAVDLWNTAQTYLSKLQATSLTTTNPVRLLLVISALALAMTVPYISSYMNPVAPSLSINGSLGSPTTISLTSSTGTAIALSTPSAAKMIKPTMPTVTVTDSKSSTPNSLMSHIDLSALSETFQSLASSPNERSCMAEVLDGHKILMRIPSGIKMSWLAKGDMSVNITRGGKSISTENAYCSPDGIVLEIAKEEAFGVFNVSVLTTKKPKINEVFLVDFGSRSIQQEVMVAGREISARLMSLFPVKSLKEIERSMNWTSPLRLYEEALNETRKFALSTRVGAEVVKKETLKTAHSASMELAKGSAVISKEISLRLEDVNKRVSATLQDVQSKVGGSVLKAQVNSKLYWLKLRGKHAEYEQYEKRAAEARAISPAALRAKNKADRAAKTAAKKSAFKQRHSTRAGKRCAKKGSKGKDTCA